MNYEYEIIKITIRITAIPAVHAMLYINYYSFEFRSRREIYKIMRFPFAKYPNPIRFRETI